MVSGFLRFTDILDSGNRIKRFCDYIRFNLLILSNLYFVKNYLHIVEGRTVDQMMILKNETSVMIIDVKDLPSLWKRIFPEVQPELQVRLPASKCSA